jgi:hypothetical protein
MEDVIFYGTLPFQQGRPKTSRGARGELDALTLEMVANPEDWEDQLAAEGIVEFEKLEGWHSMWVQTLAEEGETDAVTVVSISAVGLLKPGEKRKRTIKVEGQEYSVGPTERTVIVTVDAEKKVDPATDAKLPGIVRRRVPKLDSLGEVENLVYYTPAGSGPRWSIGYSSISVADRYFVTTKPSTTAPGNAMTPPNPPLVGFSSLSSYGSATRKNYPSGWILTSRSSEEIARVSDADGLWIVEDVFDFRPSSFPE